MMTYSNILFETPPTLEFIKKLGLEKRDSNLNKLIELFYRYTEIDMITSSTKSKFTPLIKS
ncbi:hypothetical protein CUP1496 [Campylobacter upsaliensis RM3195]|nr:hypothetical protein CUP1496 [Campylobacter upsaliensis RM3195]